MASMYSTLEKVFAYIHVIYMIAWRCVAIVGGCFIIAGSGMLLMMLWKKI